jgi:outer membrane protein X
MKKTFILTLVICAAGSMTFAQNYEQNYSREYKPFKVGIGVGYAQPGTGEGAGGGFLMYVEPAYRATDQVAIGLRLEGAFVVRGVKGISNNDISGDASSVTSFSLNGQYYFSNNKVRPFIGAGFGLFSLAAAKFTTVGGNDPDLEDINAETRFGFYPRLGLDVGHFNITLDYNVVPPTDVPGGGEVKNNYLGIKAGFSIGGGNTGTTTSRNDR